MPRLTYCWRPCSQKTDAHGQTEDFCFTPTSHDCKRFLSAAGPPMELKKHGTETTRNFDCRKCLTSNLVKQLLCRTVSFAHNNTCGFRFPRLFFRTTLIKKLNIILAKTFKPLIDIPSSHQQHEHAFVWLAIARTIFSPTA